MTLPSGTLCGRIGDGKRRTVIGASLEGDDERPTLVCPRLPAYIGDALVHCPNARPLCGTHDWNVPEPVPAGRYLVRVPVRAQGMLELDLRCSKGFPLHRMDFTGISRWR